jgi:hypothetical protein
LRNNILITLRLQIYLLRYNIEMRGGIFGIFKNDEDVSGAPNTSPGVANNTATDPTEVENTKSKTESKPQQGGRRRRRTHRRKHSKKSHKRRGGKRSTKKRSTKRHHSKKSHKRRASRRRTHRRR